MSRLIEMGVINVAMMPHERGAKDYVDIFRFAQKAALEKRTEIKLRGEVYAILATMVPMVSDAPENGLTGEILRYTKINVDDAWLNIETIKEATEDELAGVNIPKNLRPHMTPFRYIFFPKEHRFVFQLHQRNRGLGHTAAVKLLDGILHQKEVMLKHPNVDISLTVEQERSALQTIYDWPELRHMKIVVKRPNSDDADADLIKQIEKELEAQHARQLTTELDGAKRQSLKPNVRNQKLARVAVSNGHVEAEGRGINGRKISMDTREHPIVGSFEYDAKSRLAFADQFISAAQRILAKLKKNADS